MDRERRFGGVTRLYGTQRAEILRQANVCVIGIGGVGSWSVEALARTGIGRITMVDMDVVAESNTNRQIHALGNIYGKSKIEAMSERIYAINPECEITCVDEFISEENVEIILSQNFSVVVDAIDQVRAKAAMIVFCRKNGIPIVVTGAAGGQEDPTQIRISDLSQTIQDPLLAKVRSTLRREYGFPRDKKKFGISAIFSTEALRHPEAKPECDLQRVSTGLNCAGFGSSVCVTSAFGMAATARAIQLITSS